MSVEAEAGYDPAVVWSYLAAHTTAREDGRFLTFHGRMLEDTTRDTFDRWFGRPNDHAKVLPGDEPWPRIPLDRWDEILCNYGVMLWEFEHWAAEHHGSNGFLASSD